MSPLLHSLKFHKDTVLLSHLLTLALPGWLGSGRAHRCFQMTPATSCPPIFWLLLVLGSPAWHYRENKGRKVLPGEGPVPANPQKPSLCVSSLRLLLASSPPRRKANTARYLFILWSAALGVPTTSEQRAHELKTIKRHKTGIGNDGQFLESAIKCQFEEPQLTLGPEDHLWGSVTRRGRERSSYSLTVVCSQSPDNPGTFLQTLPSESLWLSSGQHQLVCLFPSCFWLWEACRRPALYARGQRGSKCLVGGTSSVIGLSLPGPS